MATANRVEYGLKNLYFAKLTKATGSDGAVSYTYATPVRIPGVQSISLDPEGSSEDFYADDSKYFTATANNGYSGEIGLIAMTDDVLINIFKHEKTSDGLLVEPADVLPNEGAIIFEFDGDAAQTRHILYDCAFSRGSTSANTKEDSISPTTATISYSAAPIELASGRRITKAKVLKGETAYDDFFKEVNVPTTLGVTETTE
jgi:phi13 family phage major tail protein